MQKNKSKTQPCWSLKGPRLQWSLWHPRPPVYSCPKCSWGRATWSWCWRSPGGCETAAGEPWWLATPSAASRCCCWPPLRSELAARAPSCYNRADSDRLGTALRLQRKEQLSVLSTAPVMYPNKSLFLGFNAPPSPGHSSWSPRPPNSYTLLLSLKERKFEQKSNPIWDIQIVTIQSL